MLCYVLNNAYLNCTLLDGYSVRKLLAFRWLHKNGD